jgi:hypothetical protein
VVPSSVVDSWSSNIIAALPAEPAPAARAQPGQ